LPLSEGNTPSTRPSPFEQTQRSEAAELLHRFLESLDDAKRVVFVLSELEEMSAPEISSVAGVSVNTIYARLRTARRLFVEAVRSETAKERGVFDE
jgi:RNA polymerase sigma-70 factor (ECF subfamily)